MSQATETRRPNGSATSAVRLESLDRLRQLLDEQGPRVAFIHGIAGIGKSWLVAQFAAEARTERTRVVAIDCGEVEPTADGFIAAISEELGVDPAGLDGLVARLAELSAPIVLVLDRYEVFLALDTWLRLTFSPGLPASTHIVLAGREPPSSPWLTAPRSHGEFLALPVGPLPKSEALAMLADLGVVGADASRVNRVARGHPLALTIAARLALSRPDHDIEDLATQAVVEELAVQFQAEAADATTREALDAASVVRRLTSPLLRAMAPDLSADEAIEGLRGLSFVESGRDGLVVHDAVKEAIVTALRSSDPDRHHRYRVGAWGHLRSALAGATRASLWRHTADLLYLLEQPNLRECFFPVGYQPVVVEPATPDDQASFEAILAAHEGPESQRALRAWWDYNPDSVKMVRGREGEAVGFLIALPGRDLDRRILSRDPIAAAWAHDMHRHRDANASLLFRCWLDAEAGDATPSATYGATNVELKRMYVEERPKLQHVYSVARDFPWDVVETLQLKPLPAADRELDGIPYVSIILDMGVGSVEGWLTRIIAGELGAATDGDDQLSLDPEVLEARFGAQTIELSPLEFRVLAHLSERAEHPVSRAELLERVWPYESEATSNVVDVTISGLRRRLGGYAQHVQTVRGRGYRYVT